VCTHPKALGVPYQKSWDTHFTDLGSSSIFSSVATTSDVEAFFLILPRLLEFIHKSSREKNTHYSERRALYEHYSGLFGAGTGPHDRYYRVLATI
jgi:hypothetical protein